MDDWTELDDIEWQAERYPHLVREVEPGVFEGSPYAFCFGVSASDIRSGVDGPYAGLADRLCNLNGRLYE